jgi:RNA polymerase primary sigma factor
VIRLRFGLIDDHQHTLEEIGKIMGLTREGIRQIEKKTLVKLRLRLEQKNAEDFL